MKVNVFYSKMALFNDNLEKLADYLGISRQSLTAKLQGRFEFKRNEIKKIAVRWNLTPEEVCDIFDIQETTLD